MTRPERQMRTLAVAAGVAASALGVLVIAGWILDAPLLKSVQPGLAPMKLNSAVCFALAGAALLGVRSGARARGLTVPLALVVGAIAAATLAEYALDVNLGIDQALFREAATEAARVPGRMSILTAAGLALIAGALVAAARPSGVGALVANALAGLAAAPGLAGVVGHAFGAAPLRRGFAANDIAIHSAVALLILALGIIAARRDAGVGRLLALDSAAGKLARRTVPACVIIPVALGWACLTAWDARLVGPELGVALLATGSVMVFTQLALIAAAQTDREEEARHRADEALREANQALEQRVRERTAALAAAQSQVRAILDGAPDAIVTVRDDGAIDDSNPAAAAIFGRDAAALRGAPFATLVAERDRAALAALLARAHRGEPVPPTLLVAQGRGGRELPVEITLAAWQQDGAAPVVATARDVSERESIAAALRRSESNFRRILETANDAIWVHRERRIVYANPSLARALGYERAEELVGQGVFDHLHPEERAGISDRMVRAAAGETRVAMFRRTDGEDVALELAAVPVEWDGAPAMLIVGRDVTERQRAEAELRRTSALLRAILDSTSYMIVSTDLDGTIQEVSRAVERTLGWGREELIGRETPVRFHEPRELAARGGWSASAVDEGEWTFVRKDGTRLPVSLSRTVLTDGEGQPMGALAVASDITDARRARQELIEAKEAAENAMRSRSEFLARMSHEIRTPLNGVIGMTDLALATDLDRLQRDYLETVRVSAEHLLTLINDILDFSRMDAGKLRLESTSFHIADALGGVLRGLAARAYEKGLELILDVAADVPARVVGDPHRLAQIVVNLAGNAIKFTDRGEVLVAVSVAAHEGERVYLDVRVRDTGIGIEPDKLEIIFDAFQQADNTMARRFGGTGLGLAIARDLARMMGGEMTVASTPGRGSEFAFTIPLGIDGAARVGDAPRRGALADVPVLVVEDSSTLRELLCRMLRSWGLAPAGMAPSAAKALTSLAPYRLVMIDGDDFVTDALGTMRSLRADDPAAPPVVILSAGSRITSSGERSWIAGHVPKPVTPSNLLETVEAVLIGAKRRHLRASAPLPPVKARRVLIADDNAVNRKVARGILERAGHEVVAVEHGRAALETLGRERFDVALLDVEMPVLDGLETTRAIRAAEGGRGAPRLPIVALTAQAMSGDRERCLAAGADAYVAKPFEPKELLALVESLAPAPTGVAARRASVAVAPVGPAIWNRAELLDRVSGDRALLLELIELFHEQAPKLRAQLVEAASAGDAAGVARIAHQLKGMLATLGAQPASAAARDLEEALRDGVAVDLAAGARIVAEAVLRVEEATAAENSS